MKNRCNETLPNDRRLVISGYVYSSEGVWLYEIRVTGSAGLLSQYVIRKRFNDFKRLYFDIQKLFPQLTLPELPNYGFWNYMFNSQERILQDRVVQLQDILTKIQTSPLTRYSDTFTSFLGEQPFSKDQETGGYISLERYASSTELVSEMDERISRKSSKSFGSSQYMASSSTSPSRLESPLSMPSVTEHNTYNRVVITA